MFIIYSIHIPPTTKSNLDSTTHSPKKSLPGSFNKQNFIYAEALYEMNTLKINEEVPLHQIITKYCNDIHDAFIDSGDFSVSSLWKYMVDISILNSQTELNKMNDTNRQLLLVSLSIKHLERLFIAHIDSSIQMNYDDVSNIENKSMTTQSNDLNKLLLFIKTQENLNSRYNSGQNHFDEILDEDGKFGEISIWKIIFYCCRTGSLQSLMFVINNCRQQLGESYEFLKGFFIDHQNQEVFGQMREDLLITYKRKVFNSRNCYKKLIYCLMGKFDLDCDFSSILPTTEDYLWFALNQLNSPQKIEDLKSFQHIVRDSYGEEYFRADVQPFTYFIVLLMTLQYEFALEFLERSQHGKQL
ncbi:MAG: Nucleoporin nup93 [Marteilia pararefringens]